MKYIIMCGGDTLDGLPKQMAEVNGEALVERTIRILRQEGITDIAISTRNDDFERFGVPLLKHDNTYFNKHGKNYWVDGFYPSEDPVCYVFGDVYFSDEAIKTMVETQTDDVMFFASAPPFSVKYPKPWAEPFGFKVVNQEHFKEAIKEVKRLCDSASFYRHPVAWELWQVLKGTRINFIDYSNYTVINDYTCDIDKPEQIRQWRYRL